MKNIKDEWETPLDLFSCLHAEFEFVADACATRKNSKCKTFFKDALKCDWHKMLKEKNSLGAVFMNPPYSDPEPFLAKAWHESKRLLVVCLVPNNILTCKYFDMFDIHNGETIYRSFSQYVKFRFLSRRTRFYHPSKKMSAPPGGCMVMILDRRKSSTQQ